MRLGAAIRARREVLELNQRQLGGLLGVSASQIAKYESGQTSTSVVMLKRFAAALATTMNDLVNELEDTQ